MKHLRAVIVVVVALVVAALVAALGWARYGVAAAVGASIATVGVALVHGHGPRRAFAGAAVAAFAAVGVHLFFARALGSGMPAVLRFASGVGLAPLVTAVMAAWAWRDHPRV